MAKIKLWWHQIVCDVKKYEKCMEEIIRLAETTSHNSDGLGPIKIYGRASGIIYIQTRHAKFLTALRKKKYVLEMCHKDPSISEEDSLFNGPL